MTIKPGKTRGTKARKQTMRDGSTQTANTRLINQQDTGEHRWTQEEMKKQNDIKPGNWTNSTSHSWSVQISDPHEDRVHCQLSASRRVIQTTQVVCWIWLLNRILTSSYSISCASRHTTAYIWTDDGTVKIKDRSSLKQDEQTISVSALSGPDRSEVTRLCMTGACILFHSCTFKE